MFQADKLFTNRIKTKPKYTKQGDDWSPKNFFHFSSKGPVQNLTALFENE